MDTIYYLYEPVKELRNPYWYKYLEISYQEEDYIWGFRPLEFFKSDLFLIYITKKAGFQEERITYNVCELDKGIILYYFNNYVYIKTEKKCHNKILKILNEYQKILCNSNVI
jgi:hypothetical protein